MSQKAPWGIKEREAKNNVFHHEPQKMNGNRDPPVYTSGKRKNCT